MSDERNTVKISVSLPQWQVRLLDTYSRHTGIQSRSAVLRTAINTWRRVDDIAADLLEALTPEQEDTQSEI